MDKFSNRLEILIKENKTKKKDLAAAIGLSPQAITEMVKGRSGTSKPALKAIANYYHVREEWLEYGTLPIMKSQEGKTEEAKERLDLLDMLGQLEGEELEKAKDYVRMILASRGR